MKKLAVFALLVAFVCTLGCSGDAKSTTKSTVTSTGQTTTGK